MCKKFSLLATALAAVGTFVAGTLPAAAQTDWPTREVNVIIPWAAGGGTDPLARLIFDDMAQRLGQAFPLDFRPGAAGTIGSNTAAKADPDGYTMLFTSGAPLVNANFMPNVAYDPKADLVPVAQVTYTSNVIAANADTPFDNFQELIDYAKANPGKVDAAFSGVGGNSHLTAVTVQHKTGAQFNVVPYTGSGAQQADLMSGVVDIGFGFAAGFLPGVEGGRLKYLTVLADQRNPNLPDVSASDESQHKGVYRGGWFGAFAPAGTPPEIIDKMNAEIRASIAKPEIASKIEDLGYFVVTGTPEDFAKQINTEITEMKELVDQGIFKIE